MAHVVRSWRSSRMIRLIVLLALLGTGLAQHATPQTKVIGSDRLVSVEPLPELAEFVTTSSGVVGEGDGKVGLTARALIVCSAATLPDCAVTSWAW